MTKTKKKTVKKAARKAAKKTPRPTKTPVAGAQVVDPAKVNTLVRGRAVEKYVDLAKQIESLAKGAGLTYVPPGVKDVVRFRSSLVTSLTKTVERLNMGFTITVSTLADKTGFLITKQ